MKKNVASRETCQICKNHFLKSALIPAVSVRDAVAALIKEKNPDWSSDGYICQRDLSTFRGLRVERLLESERGELTALESDVVTSMREHELLASNLEKTYSEGLTFPQKLADKVASFGGSWSFILVFLFFILAWIILNSLKISSGSFDPFPYILLNLILSCIAAMQAPVIMMSQNRQDAKDRLRSRHEYQINLKAELEIRHLHEKIDHLLSRQWQSMAEIQKLQLELLMDISSGKHQTPGPEQEHNH